jgi:NDP-sugar pyrophosphorylase family protein
MNFVIPMAGKGQRFINKGYAIPKYLIKVKGKTLLEYSLNSLPLELANRLIFIALSEHEQKFSIKKAITEITGGKNFEIIFIDQVTRGQAETVLKAKELINNEEDLVIYNIDTYFNSYTLSAALKERGRHDGVIGYFKDTDPKWSFAVINPQTGFVTETAEKKPISNNALTGLYHFSKGSDFVRIAEKYLQQGTTTLNEYFIAPMYNDLIAEGKNYVIDYAETFIPLGTPEDVEKFRTI